MNQAAFDESSLSVLILAKRAQESGLYSEDNYAIVARACSVAQALQIGINAGLVSNHPDTQAAFFVSLGIPGRPSMIGVPLQARPQEAEASSSSVNQPQGSRRRRRRAGTGRSSGLREQSRP